jgi:hypothetical protein
MTTHTPPLDGYTIYDPVDPFEMRAGPFFWKRRDDGSHHFVLEALIEAEAEVVRRTNTLCFLRGQVTSGGETLLNSSCIYRLFRNRA